MASLVSSLVSLTLNAAGATWSAKNVNIPNSKAKAALGAEWDSITKAASLVGVTLADDGFTFANYEDKKGQRQLSSPKVAWANDTACLCWGSETVPLSSLKVNKGIELAFEAQGKGYVMTVTELLADDEYGASYDFPVIYDKEGLGEEGVKVLKAALRSGKWMYKATVDGVDQEKPLLKAAGGSFVRLGEYEGQSVTVVGLEPKDGFGKNNLVVLDANGQRVSLSGNTATQATIERYLSVVKEPFTADEPGTLIVGEGRVVQSTGKTTYAVTLICPKASKAVPAFSM